MNREAVLERLKSVQDPVFQKSLVELNLIRDVMVRQNKISLTLVTTDEDETSSSQAVEQIKQILSETVEEVHVRVRAITDYERVELQKRLSGEQSEQPSQSPPPRQQQQHTHGAGLQAPLLAPEAGVEFIAVASGKGGVGKSTVTANLAVALARQGKKVGIIDADIYGFSIPDMMGITEAPQQVDNKIVPVVKFDVKVISMGFFVEDNSPVIWRGPMLGKMLRNFFAEINWGELDYLLLDLPPGTGDIALDVHQMIPHSKEIIVTTPHATAAFVAARAGAMAIHTKHELLGVVENMSYFQCGSCESKEYVFGRGGGAKLAEELHTSLLAEIPLQAPDNHFSEPDYSPSVYKADSEIGKIYLDMAKTIIEKTKP